MSDTILYRALVIDDNADNRLFLTIGLQHAGYDVSEASNGFDGLQVLQSTVFHLLVLDLQMPHMSGLEVLQRLRSNQAYDSLHIIIATANAHIAASDELTQQADFILYKPIDLMNFIKLVARLKGVKRSAWGQRSAD